MKALHLLALFLGSTLAHGGLLWQSGGVDLDTLDLTLGAMATLTLYQDDPAAHLYSVTMGSVVRDRRISVASRRCFWLVTLAWRRVTVTTSGS
jgi:hypothetical protein